MLVSHTSRQIVSHARSHEHILLHLKVIFKIIHPRGRTDLEWFASVDAQHYVFCVGGTKNAYSKTNTRITTNKTKMTRWLDCTQWRSKSEPCFSASVHWSSWQPQEEIQHWANCSMVRQSWVLEGFHSSANWNLVHREYCWLEKWND